MAVTMAVFDVCETLVDETEQWEPFARADAAEAVIDSLAALPAVLA